MNIFVDTTTGTWGNAKDMIEIVVTEDELEDLDEMADSTLITWCKRRHEALEGRPGEVSFNKFEIRFDFHSPDFSWSAVFMRDGKQWLLDGALVGLALNPQGAFANLVETAQHLIQYRENFLTPEPISEEDRVWLATKLDALHV